MPVTTLHHPLRRWDATYVDTSVWCAYGFRQAESAPAVAWLEAQDLTHLGTAWWAETEFASALSIQVRKKALSQGQARHAGERFADLMAAVHRLNVIEADFLQAADWVANAASGLRGGDALHLAVAQRHGCKAVATLDAAMRASAQRLGFRIVTLSNR